MSAVFEKLNELGEELTTCQADANMVITDASVMDAVERIKKSTLHEVNMVLCM